MSETSYQNTTFDRPDGGTGHGYLELPPSGRGPALVVVQEWWGLTDHVADLVRRFAADGFVALAPDLYGGRTTHDGEEAARLMQELPVERAAADLAGAVDLLLGHEAVTSSTVGVAGFCMGGAFALTLAAQQGDRVGAVSPFYGLPDPDATPWGDLTAAVQGHYARQDRIDLGVVHDVFGRLRGVGGRPADRPVELHVYDAAHAFVNDGGPAYDAAAATTAWARATSFLRAHVR